MTALVALVPSDIMGKDRDRINSMIALWNTLGASGSILITGGTIDGTVIGNTTPANGKFTNLVATTSADLSATTLILADNQISGNKISGGTIDNVVVQLASDPTLSNHATTKNYVDAQVALLTDQLLFYSLVFGE